MWIIKSAPSGGTYWTGDAPHYWTSDRSKATRYASREGADAVVQRNRRDNPKGVWHPTFGSARIVRLVPKRKGAGATFDVEGALITELARGHAEEREAIAKWLERKCPVGSFERVANRIRAGEHRK